ncbi:MAG: DMT family transporter [Hyphomonadaceae bacterium]|nr:DMT family transporter [Hyphomonadaceae bacterium]
MDNIDPSARAHALGVIALLAGACCIALAPIMVKVSELGPQASAAWRLILALPLLALWSAVEQRRDPSPVDAKRGRVALLGWAGLWFGLDLITWHAGIVRTSAANATFLANLTPVLLVAGTWIATRKLPEGRLVVTVLIALAGAFLMSGGAPGLNPQMIKGDLLSAFWPPMTLSAWLPLIVLGAVSHVGGQGLLAWALGRVAAPVAGVIILVQPVVAGLIGWVWLGEALGGLQLAGGALVLVAVWQARQLKG